METTAVFSYSLKHTLKNITLTYFVSTHYSYTFSFLGVLQPSDRHVLTIKTDDVKKKKKLCGRQSNSYLHLREMKRERLKKHTFTKRSFIIDNIV